MIFCARNNLHYEQFADGTVKCIEDEIPFELPDGWAWCKINTIAFVTKLAGFEYTKNIAPSLCESGIPLFKGKNVQNSTIIYEFESFIPESVSDELQRSQITKKCILTPYVGTIGNIGIHSRPGKYHLGSNVGKIELYNDEVVLLEEYVVSYLQSGFGYRQLTKHMKATAQASISIEAIRDVYLPVPPANEQIRMWSALSDALNLIDTIEKTECDIGDLIKTTKSKILDLAIRGELVPQDPNDEPASVLLERIRAEKEELIKAGKIKRDKKESVIFKGDDNSYYEKFQDSTITNIEIPYTIPDSWEWCRLKDICSKIVDGAHNPPRGLESKTPYIMASSRNISDDKIVDLESVRYLDFDSFEKENKRTLLNPNDILLTTVATLGRSCIYNGNPPNLCFQRSVSVLTTLILPSFLKLIFDSPYFQNYIIENATGTAQKGFYLNQLENTIVSIPPLQEQHRIVLCVEKYFSQLNKIETALK